MPLKLIFRSHREKMYLLGVLCLLSAALALPPEQLRTNLLVPPPPPELKLEDESKSSVEKVVLDPIPPAPELLPTPDNAVLIESSDESKKQSESTEISKEEKEKVHEQPDVVQEGFDKDSKESVSIESKEPKTDEKLEDSKESKKSEEIKNGSKSEEIKESEEKKKDSKSEESKDDKKSNEDDKPILVEVGTQNPSQPGWFPFDFQWPSFHWPFFKQQYRYSNKNEQEPIYIIKESDWEY